MRPCGVVPLLSLTLAAQAPLAVQAPIRRVRLHPDEAWVTRIGSARVPVAGTHRLRVEGLPQGLALEDVRVAARGPQGLRLGDLGLRSEARKVTETPAFQALTQERERLQDRLDALDAEGEALAHEVTFLKGLQATHDKELSSRMTYVLPGDGPVVELSRGLQERLSTLLARERKRRRERGILAEEVQRVDGQLAQMKAERSASPTLATVEVTVPRAGEVELELTYRTRQAAWKPAYEARLAADGRTLELALSADVRQQSGEAWEDVQVELTNARASRSLTLSRFSGPQVVGWTEGYVQKERAADVVEVVAVQNAYAPPPPPPPPAPAQLLEAAVQTQASTREDAMGLATTWTLEGAKEVPSDGEPHRFRILARELRPDLALLAVPRLDPTVHRVARFAVPEGIPLFPGAPVVHFAGTQRVGAAALQLPSPGQPLQLGFGPFRGARVILQRVEAKKETVGTFTKETQWTLTERLEVSNDTAEALQVEVQDRELRSASDKVKVTPLPDSVVAQPSSIPGVRQWTLKVAPKGTATVSQGCQIRVPQGGSVTGLGGLGLPE
mgnify:CR=1 FL=1